jgi:hypothetical protein
MHDLFVFEMTEAVKRAARRDEAKVDLRVTRR